MTAFQPISAKAALELLKEALPGVGCASVLADLAEAGLIKGYASVTETIAPGIAQTEVRDARMSRAVWRQLMERVKCFGLTQDGL